MQNKLKAKLQDKSNFVVFAELTGGPGFNIAPVGKFLKEWKANKSELPSGFDFAAVTVPQNPGGVANIEPIDILIQAKLENWLDGLDFVPHVSCKDHNADGIVSSLMTLKRMGVNSVLA